LHPTRPQRPAASTQLSVRGLAAAWVTSRHGVLGVGRKRRSRIAPNDACIGAMRFAFAPYAAATTGGIQATVR